MSVQSHSFILCHFSECDDFKDETEKQLEKQLQLAGGLGTINVFEKHRKTLVAHVCEKPVGREGCDMSEEFSRLYSLRLRIPKTYI